METEMEMRATEDIAQGEDITPPLSPLSFSLHDSFLISHCSSCFSPLPTSTATQFYCSPYCSSLDSARHQSSELQGVHSTDVRAALRLLNLLQSPPSTCQGPRLSGLLTNRDKLLSSDEPDVVLKIREGARAMAKARGNLSDDVLLEEAALCLVMTNAVEVQNKSGRILGIAVYDKDFSWINHSCSPNACYRFLLSETNEMTLLQDQPKMRIVPHVQGGSGVCSATELARGEIYGPKIVVRSIKPITKGEEVTVAYTDLLQPKAMRQAELWLKYQFVCCCKRCTASPPTYVDRVLEEISAFSMEFLSLGSDANFHMDEANEKMTECMDEVINDYLSIGDPESCCKRLEYLLTRGLQYEHSESQAGKLQLNFMLHPLHHLALNAYMTLASAYKIQSVDLLALCANTDRHHSEAFNMKRTSAAYSLLLAGAADHLFQSESSLIASAANFWASAGESLLTLARSSSWNLTVKTGLSVSNFSIEEHKCSKCSLIDRLELNSFLHQVESAGLKNISNLFLDCISSMAQKVWSSLIHGCQHLQIFKDPIDFSWIDKSSNESDICFHLNKTNEGSSWEAVESISRRKAQQYTYEERMGGLLIR